MNVQELLRGMGVAMTTPFTNGQLDEYALRNLIDYTIEGGADYLVVLGTTAETATLSDEEKERVKKIFVAHTAGRVPLVLGMGGNNTQALVHSIETLNPEGFCALLSVSPYYNRPSQEGIFLHYKAVAEASPLPVILYNVPGRTASNVLPETVFRIAQACPNVIGIKEAKGDLEQAQKLLSGRPKDFLVLSGDDAVALPMILEGGEGVISVIGGGFPHTFSQLIALALEGRKDAAQKIQDVILPVIDAIFKEGNPTGIKAVLALRNLCQNELRLPLVSASTALMQSLETYTKRLS